MMQVSNRLPVTTLVLIGISLLVTFMTNFGQQFTTVFLFADNLLLLKPFGQILQGQLWRLITPTFLHFSELHLIFNCLWLWLLGGHIELKQGRVTLLSLFFIIGIGANIAQYLISGPHFGGLSGVVYGLFGYVWLQGLFNPKSGLHLEKQLVLFMLVWLVLGWTNFFGLLSIANTAHNVGLILGLIISFLVAWRRHRIS